jgi:hypothetical protein
VLAEIVRRRAWAVDGAVPPAAWLSWKVSMAASTAREYVRVAVALADWPLTTVEFAAGRLSYSKVRAIVSTGRPELDDLLVRYAASATGEQLHRICRAFRDAEQRTEPVDAWAARDVSRREVNDRSTEDPHHGADGGGRGGVERDRPAGTAAPPGAAAGAECRCRGSGRGGSGGRSR